MKERKPDWATEAALKIDTLYYLGSSDRFEVSKRALRAAYKRGAKEERERWESSLAFTESSVKAARAVPATMRAYSLALLGSLRKLVITRSKL